MGQTSENQLNIINFNISNKDDDILIANNNSQFKIEFIEDNKTDLKYLIVDQCDLRIPLEDIRMGVDSLIQWASISPLQLNWQAQFLFDLRAITEHWDAVEPYKNNLLLTALEFLDKNYHLHYRFPVIKYDLTYYFYKIFDTQENPILEPLKYNLELCFNEDAQLWFEHEGLKREIVAKEAVRLFMNSPLWRENSMNRNNTENEDVLERAKQWFFSRYDLKTACEIIFHNCKAKSPITFLFLWFPVWVALCLTYLSFAACFPDWISLIEIKAPSNNNPFFRYVLWGIYPVFVVMPFVFFWLSKSKNPDRIKNLQVFTPRLIGGIVAGYLLLMSDEVWRFVFTFKTDCYFSLLKAVLPLLGVYLYIFIEISHVKGIIKVGTKALLFFARAYSYAVVMGLIVSDIFGHSMMMGHEEKLAQSYFSGLIGTIYPAVLIFLAPYALFVGVVLQLLWDDKKLTDKI